jgi:hypothetical protein
MISLPGSHSSTFNASFVIRLPIPLHHLLIFIFISVEERSYKNIYTGERDSDLDAWFEKRSQE